MKSALMVTLLGATLALAATAVPHVHALSFAAVQDHDHDADDRNRRPTNRDYAGNSYYRTGNSEGYTDYQRHRQRKSHRHHYRTDEDRRAHDYGYQEGWQGRRGDRDHDADDRH